MFNFIMKSRIIVISFFLLSFICESTASFSFEGNQRIIYNFNSNWKLYVGDISGAENMVFNDSSWKTITLPRAFNEDEAFRVAISDLTDTVMWYL